MIDTKHYINYFHLSDLALGKLFQMADLYLIKQITVTKRSISARYKLTVKLQYYASGQFF